VGFNRIDEGTDLIGLNSLKTLNLESNRIGYVEDVEVLNCCINLKNLVLRGNWAQDHPDYRGAIKRLLPKLICLDDIKFGEEALQLPENPPPDNGQAPLAITYEPFPQMALPPPAHSAQLPRQAQILPPLASSGEGEESRPSSDPSVRQGLVPSTKLVKPVLKPKTWYNVGSIKL
jgi:hypothetical protein